jgi:hypothetical protein
MIKTDREILQRGDNREPIAFLTYRIGSDHNEVVVIKRQGCSKRSRTGLARGLSKDIG